MEGLGWGEGDPRKTDLPEFNTAREAVEDCLSGRAHADHGLDALDHLDAALGAMQARFLEDLPFRESTRVLDEASVTLDRAFMDLREILLRLREAVDGDQVEEGHRLLEEGGRTVQDACDALRRLREEDATVERWSEIPFVQELVRVGRAYLRGRLPLESLRLRVEAAEEQYRRLRDGVAGLAPSPREQPVMEERGLALVSALDAMERSLVELQVFVLDLDESRVEPALEEIRGAADVLLEVHRELLDAGQREEQVPCPRCGTSNPVSERFCGGCGAVLPRLAPEVAPEPPRLDLMESGARPEYENLARLGEAVAAVRADRMSREEFAEILDDMHDKVARTADRLARMQDPPTETPPDQMDLYRVARANFGEAVALMDQGLELLRGYLDERSPALLDRGMEACRLAGDRMAEVERLFEEAVARYGG